MTTTSNNNLLFLTSTLIIFMLLCLVLVLRKVLPLWILYIFLINFVICASTWEIWLTYGAVNGDSINKRTDDDSISKNENWFVLSLADALVGVVQIGCTYALFGKDVFRKWNWKAFGVIFAIGIVQNILVTWSMRSRLKNGKLSWAPLMPIQTNGIIQNQEPWIIQPFILYAIVLGLKIIK